jgi:hypothetical protein
VSRSTCGGERAIVCQDGVEGWRSPAAWRVDDLTLGDPNDDGRGELLLTFWRDDEEGVPGSHSFIVGYRGGIYRTLWGGSAVRDPILEVELGDMDGDGAQELIVLETEMTAWSAWRSGAGTAGGPACCGAALQAGIEIWC